MTNNEKQELECYIVKNINKQITGTQLGAMMQGAVWLDKFKKETIRR